MKKPKSTKELQRKKPPICFKTAKEKIEHDRRRQAIQKAIDYSNSLGW